MSLFQVSWVIEVEADSMQGAAREALRIQRDPDSIATVFLVVDDERPWDDPEVIDVREL